MPKYKLIAMDLDGTLVNSEKKITEKTKQALFKAMDEGVVVVLSSGRPECGIVALADELELDKRGGYVSAYNGAKIIDWKTKEVVASYTIDEKILPKIYEASRKNGLALLTHKGNITYAEEADNEYVILEANINKIGIHKIDSFEEAVDFPVYKFIAAAGAEELAAKEKNMADELGEFCLTYRSNPYFLEIVNPKVDKKNSLLAIAELLNIPVEQTIACGDAYNDISMIEAAGLGVAMQNAEEEVKKSADYITLSNDEDGIAYVLEKFVFC